jgi:hypothetical protein
MRKTSVIVVRWDDRMQYSGAAGIVGWKKALQVVSERFS